LSLHLWNKLSIWLNKQSGKFLTSAIFKFYTNVWWRWGWKKMRKRRWRNEKIFFCHFGP
jgi:hypothetical protein